MAEGSHSLSRHLTQGRAVLLVSQTRCWISVRCLFSEPGREYLSGVKAPDCRSGWDH